MQLERVMFAHGCLQVPETVSSRPIFLQEANQGGWRLLVYKGVLLCHSASMFA